MIKPDQLAFIEEYAYLPEHIIHYVTAVSQAEPFLFGDYLAYFKQDLLIFIGYPLKEGFEEKKLEKALSKARKRFKPRTISLIAPKLSSSLAGPHRSPSDYYYGLNLSTLSISQKLRNMLKRADRDLVVERSKTFSKEHQERVNEFLSSHLMDEAAQFIFMRIPEYVSSSPSAWIFNARDKDGTLIAFDIAEFGAKQYALYMFNVTSHSQYIPGASDLLLYNIIQMAKEEDKKFVNLGLGINQGVTFFKKKWGGIPLYPYVFYQFSQSRQEIQESLFSKL